MYYIILYIIKQSVNATYQQRSDNRLPVLYIDIERPSHYKIIQQEQKTENRHSKCTNTNKIAKLSIYYPPESNSTNNLGNYVTTNKVIRVVYVDLRK